MEESVPATVARKKPKVRCRREGHWHSWEDTNSNTGQLTGKLYRGEPKDQLTVALGWEEEK